VAAAAAAATAVTAIVDSIRLASHCYQWWVKAVMRSRTRGFEKGVATCCLAVGLCCLRLVQPHCLLMRWGPVVLMGQCCNVAHSSIVLACDRTRVWQRQLTRRTGDARSDQELFAATTTRSCLLQQLNRTVAGSAAVELNACAVLLCCAVLCCAVLCCAVQDHGALPERAVALIAYEVLQVGIGSS
jgi:hypothetical protein